jgi:triacylglycerol esterase/lipase EstA (alpha/beta hydrolase family)
VYLQSIDIYDGIGSIFHSMDDQLEALAKQVDHVKQKMNITEFNFVCHSQGSLLCRAYLQMYEHTCHNYISLAAPHMGVVSVLFHNELTNLVWNT